MKFPSHYSSIKTIFDIAVFGTENAEDILAKNKQISFTKEFAEYHNHFLEEEKFTGHDHLDKALIAFLAKSTRKQRTDIVKVIVENPVLSNGLGLLKMMSKDQAHQIISSEEFYELLFNFLSDNQNAEIVFLLANQHFLNFNYLNPADFKNYTVNKKQYNSLVADYLKVQEKLV